MFEISLLSQQGRKAIEKRKIEDNYGKMITCPSLDELPSESLVHFPYSPGFDG
jgi:hypothetical protein